MVKNLLIFIIVLFIENGLAQRIKCATILPENSVYVKILRELDAEIRQSTNGKVKFKIYPSQIQGDEKDVLRKIRLRQLHSAVLGPLGLGEILPELRVLNLPLLFHNYEEVDYINSLLYDEFSRKFEEKGFVILGWTGVGFAYVFAQKPIFSLSDLQGTKMWLWDGDPLVEAAFKSLGLNAFPLALPDVLTSLQTGLIEAVYASPFTCIAFQWRTRVKTMMDVPLAYATGAILISKRMFKKLKPEYQELLREKGDVYMKKLVRLSREEDKKAVKLMSQNGIQVVKVPPENLKEFHTSVRQTYQNLAGKLYSQELLDKVENALKEFRNNRKTAKNEENKKS